VAQLLLQNNADLSLKGSNDLTALDYAILYGYYKLALILQTSGSQSPKTSDEYLDIGKSMNLPLIDIPLICTHLELRTDPEQAPSFKLPSKKFKGKILNIIQNSGIRYPTQMKNGVLSSDEL
jgi:hypothetical protein